VFEKYFLKMVLANRAGNHMLEFALIQNIGGDKNLSVGLSLNGCC
jgi:hypothetical protein